ncbi:MAG: hypothetical protein ACLQIB_08090 [Isosphaeraceae bacterium]
MANRSRERRDFAGRSGNGLSERERIPGDPHQPGSADHFGPGTRRQRGWANWARVLASLALLFHIAAVLAGAFGVPPSSPLQRAFADFFIPYFDLVDLGYSYRFYTEPPPTPVVTATLRFGQARSDELVRLPARHLPGPPMRHQRQLALANALFREVLETRERSGAGSSSPLARAYARHLCRTRPGCQSVTLHLERHLIPEPDAVLRATSAPGAPAYDLFDESLFTTPEWIGDFPCDDF